jgi:hypothetical protein
MDLLGISYLGEKKKVYRVSTLIFSINPLFGQKDGIVIS